MAFKPTWAFYHRLGEQYAAHLQPNYSFAEIGREIGVSKQKAYHECMVALGKLVYGLKKTTSNEAHGV